MNHQRIVDEIIGDDSRLRHLLLTNAEFHAYVTTAVRVLGPLVQLMADDAERSAQEREAAIRLARDWPVGPGLPGGER